MIAIFVLLTFNLLLVFVSTIMLITLFILSHSIYLFQFQLLNFLFLSSLIYCVVRQLKTILILLRNYNIFQCIKATKNTHCSNFTIQLFPTQNAINSYKTNPRGFICRPMPIWKWNENESFDWSGFFIFFLYFRIFYAMKYSIAVSG